MKAREQGLGARSAPALVAAAALLAGCGAEANDAISSAALGISTAPTSGGLSPVTPGVAGSGGSASGGAGSGGSAGGGTAAPMMSIVAPKHGEPLYPTSTWYDDATDTIAVRGGVSNLPPQFVASGNYAVLLNGQFPPNTVTPLPQQGRISFAGRVPAIDDWDWAMRGVMVELVDTTTDEVVARDTISYFDLRQQPSGSPTADDKAPLDGMYLQITDSGLGYTGVTPELTGLEGPHFSLLPWPKLTDFNDQLGEAARSVPRVLDTDADRNACINLADVAEHEERLAQTSEFPTYRKAYNKAMALYLAYEAYQRGEIACSAIFPGLGSLACELAVASACVKHEPKAKDFELCVDEVEGELTDLEIARVDDVSLQFLQTPPNGDGARIQSHVTLEGIEGRADAFLRKLSVRWADATCIGRPIANLDDAKIAETPWLEEWTTCRDLELDADAADTYALSRPEKFEVKRATENAELEVVSQYEDARFAFVAPSMEVEKDSCALEFLVDDVEEKATELQALLADPLDDTWNDGGANTQQAEALELTLKRLELGVPEHVDFTFDAKLEDPYSKPLAGMKLGYETWLSAKEVSTTERLYPGRLYLPPVAPPPFQLDALDNAGNPFDLAYTLSTGYLNQILHIRSATDRLHFDFQPTWDELAAFGVTPASTGHDPALPPPLDGSVLGQLDATFDELGGTALQIHVKPTLDVVFWMAPDPLASHPIQGSPVGYGVSGLEIRFAEPDAVDPTTGETIPGKEWMRVVLAVADRDFRISLPDTGSFSTFMEVGFNEDQWGASVLSTAFSGCPMVPHGVLEPPTSCERQLEDTLTALFQARLSPLLLDMLSDIPAPNVWDANRKSRTVRQVDQSQHYMEGQLMTFYANFDQ